MIAKQPVVGIKESVEGMVDFHYLPGTSEVHGYATIIVSKLDETDALFSYLNNYIEPGEDYALMYNFTPNGTNPPMDTLGKGRGTVMLNKIIEVLKERKIKHIYFPLCEDNKECYTGFLRKRREFFEINPSHFVGYLI